MAAEMMAKPLYFLIIQLFETLLADSLSLHHVTQDKEWDSASVLLNS